MQSDSSANMVEFLTDRDLSGLEIRSSRYRRCSFSKHSHDTWSVGVVLDGQGTYTQKGTTYSIGQGHIVLIAPDEFHACNPENGSPWAYLMFHVSRSLFLRVAADAIGERPGEPMFASRVLLDPEIVFLMVRLFKLVKSGAAALEKEDAMFTAFAKLLLRHGKPAPMPPEPREPQVIGLIKESLADNFEKNISMNELSHVAGVSAYHMLHVFHRTVGMTPHAFQVQMRIKKARKLLLKGYSIVDAALATGFCDQSHFTKKFKPIVGLTPRRYVLSHHSA